MPIITFASPKGGTGKTTSAIVLATTLTRRHRVVLVDADPAARLTSWSKKGLLAGRLKVQQTQGEKFIEAELLRAQANADFVVVDLQGAATAINAHAIGTSDLVIIPMGDEQQDAEAAIETLSQVKLESKLQGRDIPARVLFARTQAGMKTRLSGLLNAQVRDKVGSFTVELNSRTAIAWLHNLGGTLYDIPEGEVSGLPQAIANAESFTDEVVKLLSWLASMRRAREQVEERRVVGDEEPWTERPEGKS